MNNKNILFLSAGRRVDLVRIFLNELKKKRINSSVYIADMNPELSSACHVVKKSFKLPSLNEPNYISDLLKICKKNLIKIIIPTIDPELNLLSKSKNYFLKKGIEIIISDNDFVKVSLDKRLTKNLFKKLNIPVLKLYSRNNIKFPCYAKPYNGSSSKMNFKISSKKDLTPLIYNNKRLIYEKYVGKDFDEYTVDIYYDKFGDLKSLIPRKRIEVRAGEISKGITKKNKLYSFLLPKLKKLKGVKGCINCQFFLNKKNNKIFGIEINARFGGGFPLSYASRGNYAGWIIDEYLLNKKIKFFDKWKKNLLMLRFDEKIIIDGNKKI